MTRGSVGDILLSQAGLSRVRFELTRRCDKVGGHCCHLLCYFHLLLFIIIIYLFFNDFFLLFFVCFNDFHYFA